MAFGALSSKLPCNRQSLSQTGPTSACTLCFARGPEKHIYSGGHCTGMLASKQQNCPHVVGEANKSKAKQMRERRCHLSDFQISTLRRDRERRFYGVTKDQTRADATASRVVPPKKCAHNDTTSQNNGTEGVFTVTPGRRGGAQIPGP